MLVFNVDDDVDDRGLFIYAVKAADSNICCVSFENGQDLLTSLAIVEILPDYIFIDINMPKMNGYECVQEIKLNDRLKHINIIMHSTAFTEKDVTTFREMGVGFLLKCIRIGDLIQEIKKLMA